MSAIPPKVVIPRAIGTAIAIKLETNTIDATMTSHDRGIGTSILGTCC